MTDAKLRKVVKAALALAPDLTPEAISAALDVLASIEPGTSPKSLATLIRSVVWSWDWILKHGHLPYAVAPTATPPMPALERPPRPTNDP